eukprot:1516668-Pyramimonas_sp.AAC.1
MPARPLPRLLHQPRAKREEEGEGEGRGGGGGGGGGRGGFDPDSQALPTLGETCHATTTARVVQLGGNTLAAAPVPKAQHVLAAVPRLAACHAGGGSEEKRCTGEACSRP